MGTVTYKSQPAVEATKGRVPLEGTRHLYTVNRLLWPEEVEAVLRGLLIGRSLHVCCGKSRLGDVRLDLNEASADLRCDAANMRELVGDDAFETVLCDPPYTGRMQWNHDLLCELARVASRRIVFQHWFIPATSRGLYKKAQEKFALTALYNWQPRTYFGRVQVVSVFDRLDGPTQGALL